MHTYINIRTSIFESGRSFHHQHSRPGSASSTPAASESRKKSPGGDNTTSSASIIKPMDHIVENEDEDSHDYTSDDESTDEDDVETARYIRIMSYEY
jgi:hypothetical protein